MRPGVVPLSAGAGGIEEETIVNGRNEGGCMTRIHRHKWEDTVCNLTGCWLEVCKCGAQRFAELDQDDAYAESITDADCEEVEG